MATAILIDGDFFIRRYRFLIGKQHAQKVANDLHWMCREHLKQPDGKHDLYRIFFYDCPPLTKKAHNPISKKAIDFSATPTAIWRTELHHQLRSLRKVALRLGYLNDRTGHWNVRPDKLKQLLAGNITVKNLTESDVLYDVSQKGVDMRIGLDIASLAFKTFLEHAISTTAGVNHPRTSWNALKVHVLAVPPIPEQRAIAAVLRTVQGAKKACERVLAATRQLKQSLLHHLFTYGPVPFPQAAHVQLKETMIGSVPEHWNIAKLGDFAQLAQYGLSLRGNPSGRYPILRMNNLQDGKIVIANIQGGLQYVELDDKTVTKFRLTIGDLLFNRTNSFELVGKTSLFELPGDFVFASYIVRLQLDSKRLDPRFANYCLNMPATQARLKFLASRGVSQSNINATKLKGFEMPIPPLPEQRDIAARLAAVDAKLAAEESRRSALAALLQSLLHNLMTGQVRLPDCAGIAKIAGRKE